MVFKEDTGGSSTEDDTETYASDDSRKKVSHAIDLWIAWKRTQGADGFLVNGNAAERAADDLSAYLQQLTTKELVSYMKESQCVSRRIRR